MSGTLKGLENAITRAYSVLNIKEFQEQTRSFQGIATTPNTDRQGDIIEPLGVAFNNPLPLLMYHRSTMPVGHVTFQRPTPDGISFHATMPNVTEPGTLKDRIDEAWQSIKHGLIKGVSIGFKPVKGAYELIKETGGIRYLKSEVLELSLVVVPANVDATIQTIKSLDHEILTALGNENRDRKELAKPAGASASSHKTKGSSQMAKTIAEQISSYEATRAAKDARMKQLMDESAEKGETLDDAGEQEYDTLEAEVNSIDKHLVRLHAQEKRNEEAAEAIDGKGSEEGSKSRELKTGISFKKKELPKGMAFTRYAIALGQAKGNLVQALEISKKWEHSSPEVIEVLKSAVAAGTTTDSGWASQLVVYQNMVSEFAELLRPATIIGRIPNLRRVPFNILIPRQTAGSTTGWVGQGAPKPVSRLTFDSLSLGMSKASGIVIITEELLRSSAPSAEALISTDLVQTITQFLDAQFVDPTVAEVANVSPASITNGVIPVTASGTTIADLREDLQDLIEGFTAANLSLAGAVWIMTETMAQTISMMQNALGQPQFPGMAMIGGVLMGLPVISSENIPDSATSGGGSRIILVKAPEILLADDGNTVLDVSREASVQMDSAPDNPMTASTVMVSLWQANLVGIKAERFINWKKRRSAAVQYIDHAAYVF